MTGFKFDYNGRGTGPEADLKTGSEYDKSFNQALAKQINKYWFAKGYNPEVKVIRISGYGTINTIKVMPVYIISSNLIGTNGIPTKKWHGPD